MPRMMHSSLLLVLLLLPAIEGFIDVGGICSLLVFLPFTLRGFHDSGGLNLDFRTNYGFSHMAAALMAAEHFNTRNSSVVPELADLEGCNLTFSLGNESFLDTGSLTRMASTSLFRQSELPCAIAGPFNDYPALELSVMAQAAEIPIVAHRSFNPRVVSNFYSRFTTVVYPDLLASSRNLVSFLRGIGRTNYIGFLYALLDINVQRREGLSFALDDKTMEWTSATYLNPDARKQASTYATDSRTPSSALLQLKDSGYRTIVVAMDAGWELQAIADAAEALQMNQGDHFWVWYDVFEPFFISPNFSNNNVTKLVSGSAWMLPLSGADIKADTDPFHLAWRSQGKREIDRLNAANPISPGQPGYKFANNDFFQSVAVEFGSAFMYDAVISAGLGACLAQAEAGKVSGIDHVSGIRHARFTGATGPMAFGTDDGDLDRNGTRLASTVTWGVFNLMPPQHAGSEPVSWVRTGFLSPGSLDDSWEDLEPFIYRDGRTIPPNLLRDEPDQNYLSNGLRILGLTLMSIAIVAAVASAAWVFLCRKHRVLVASQPIFLYLICFGALIQASAIFTISFDESYGWNDYQLSSACMATPWLISLGHIIIYASLFTKMWRVNQVLQFTRRQIKISHVAWPLFVLVLLDLVLLSLWTALDPLAWQRTVTNDVTDESIGQCDSEHYAAFYATMAVLTIIPTVLTGVFAWKTKDVDRAYTESRWIFFMILVQLEVILVALPVIVILRDVSTNGRYLGYSILIWTFPMSALGFIVVPKYIAYRRAVLGLNVQSKSKRGARASIRVSGAVNSSATNKTISRQARLSSGSESVANTKESLSEPRVATEDNNVEDATENDYREKMPSAAEMVTTASKVA